MDENLDIVRRKERLISRCAGQRESIAGSFRELAQPISLADRALGVARFLRAHPVLVVGAVAMIVAVRRRSLPLALAARVLMTWRMWRKVAAWAEGTGLDFLRAYGPGKG